VAQTVRAKQRLRHEHEAFKQLKAQAAQWFVLRLVVGYSSVLLLFVVIVICTIILFSSNKFPEFIVKAAGATLFVEVIGLLVGAWRLLLKK
jgi:hypothetical protein